MGVIAIATMAAATEEWTLTKGLDSIPRYRVDDRYVRLSDGGVEP